MESPPEWGKLKFLPGPNHGRYPYCHSLFWDGEVKVLVDPACDPELLRNIKDSGGVDIIILSHYHEDHFANMYLFPEAKLYVHRLDAPPLADIETLFDYYDMEPGHEERERFEQALKDFFHFTPRDADLELEDGMVLDFGELHIEVLHTPGHSPGHCCFYFKEPDVLFMADYDLTRFGPWYGDRVSDLEDLIKSAEKVRNHPAKWKVAAHEDGILEGNLEERWKSYMAVIDRRETDLLEFLTEPKTMDDIINRRIVYGKTRQPESFYDFGERGIMSKHVKRLLDRGVLRRDGDRYVKN